MFLQSICIVHSFFLSILQEARTDKTGLNGKLYFLVKSFYLKTAFLTGRSYYRLKTIAFWFEQRYVKCY